MSDDNDLTTDAVPTPPRSSSTSTKQNSNNDGRNADHTQKDSANSQKSQNFTPRSSGSFPICINIVNSEGVHIGSSLKFIYKNKNKDKKSKKNKCDITDSIKNLFSITNPVECKDIQLLSSHMENDEWKNTARQLGYSDGQISQFYGSHFHSGIKEVIYQFLLDWIEAEAEQATVKKLSKTLWDTNHFDAVSRWAKEYNINQ